MRGAAGIAALLLAGCASMPAAPPPQDAFFERLSALCGQAFAGRMVSTDALGAGFRGAEMVMHVRECGDSRIAIPFHVRPSDEEWDRSRTWLVTRTGAGLRLKHDHRHADGAPDAVTMYGGDTANAGTAARQEFPVDAESVAMFRREGLGASVTNVWALEVAPAARGKGHFSYELRRTTAGGAPEDRHFRVEFDLSRPVAPPPAPWGHEKRPAS